MTHSDSGDSSTRENSALRLSRNIQKKTATELAEIQGRTQLELQRHEQNLRSESEAGRRSMRAVTDQIVGEMNDLKDSLRDGTAEIAAAGARIIGQHEARMESITRQAEKSARATLLRSIFPLALIWAAALSGLMVAGVVVWHLNGLRDQLQARRAELAEAENNLQAMKAEGIHIAEQDGKIYLWTTSRVFGQPYERDDRRVVRVY